MSNKEERQPIIILSKEKVIINGIEITDYESWKKVIKSLFDLKKENKQLKERIKEAIEYIDNYWYWDGTGIDELEKILKGENNGR